MNKEDQMPYIEDEKAKDTYGYQAWLAQGLAVIQGLAIIQGLADPRPDWPKVWNRTPDLENM